MFTSGFSVPLCRLRLSTKAMRSRSWSAAPSTVTLNDLDMSLPDGSVAVQVVLVVPMAYTLPEVGLHSTDTDPELSVAVAEKVTTAPLGIVALTVKLAGTLRTGG